MQCNCHTQRIDSFGKYTLRLQLTKYDQKPIYRCLNVSTSTGSFHQNNVLFCCAALLTKTSGGSRNFKVYKFFWLYFIYFNRKTNYHTRSQTCTERMFYCNKGSHTARHSRISCLVLVFSDICQLIRKLCDIGHSHVGLVVCYLAGKSKKLKINVTKISRF